MRASVTSMCPSASSSSTTTSDTHNQHAYSIVFRANTFNTMLYQMRITYVGLNRYAPHFKDTYYCYYHVLCVCARWPDNAAHNVLRIPPKCLLYTRRLSFSSNRDRRTQSIWSVSACARRICIRYNSGE